MDFIGYPLAIGLGSIYMANRFLYKRYFNPVKDINPFKELLKRDKVWLAKSRFTTQKRFWANQTILMELDGQDIVDLHILKDENDIDSEAFSDSESVILDVEKLGSEFSSSMDLFSQYLNLSKKDSMNLGEFLLTTGIGGGSQRYTFGFGGKKVLLEIRKELREANQNLHTDKITLKFSGKQTTEALSQKIYSLYRTASEPLDFNSNRNDCFVFVWSHQSKDLIVL